MPWLRVCRLRQKLSPFALQGAEVFHVRQPGRLPCVICDEPRGVLVSIEQLVYELSELWGQVAIPP